MQSGSEEGELTSEGKARAADLVTRTAKAVEYVMARHCATDLASFIELLPLPEDDRAKGDIIADGTDVFIRSLSYCASYGYGLCLLHAPTIEKAGETFRSAGVQDELRQMATRIATNVFGKGY